jgi:hypothetical protein
MRAPRLCSFFRKARVAVTTSSLTSVGKYSYSKLGVQVRVNLRGPWGKANKWHAYPQVGQVIRRSGRFLRALLTGQLSLSARCRCRISGIFERKDVCPSICPCSISGEKLTSLAKSKTSKKGGLPKTAFVVSTLRAIIPTQSRLLA